MTTYDLTADGSGYLIASLSQIDPAVIAALSGGGALYWVKLNGSAAIIAYGGAASGEPTVLSTSGGIPEIQFPSALPSDLADCAIFAVQAYADSEPVALGVQIVDPSTSPRTIDLYGWTSGLPISLVVFGAAS